MIAATDDPDSKMRDGPKIAVVLLAAGASTRFGPNNKLLEEIDGTPVVIHALRPLLTAAFAEIVVVVAPGNDGTAVSAALANAPVRSVVNPRAADGMGTSIACGVAALHASEAGVLIALADMPWLAESVVSTLVTAYRSNHGQRIVYPVTRDGQQRNPVIWPAAFRAGLQALAGAEGARHLLAANRAQSTAVLFQDDAVLSDVDTADDLRRWRAGDQVARNMP